MSQQPPWGPQGPQPAQQQQQPQQQWGAPQPMPMQSPAQQANAEQAARLVRWSRILALGGLLLATLGACGAGMAFQSPTLVSITVLLGFGLAIVGAILGQIGRAMQGRVI